MADHRIVCGDGIAGLLALPRGSVSLVCNDPPWGATQAEWDRALDWRAWWAAIDHALAPNGTAVIFASMRLAFDIAPIAARPFKHDLVWHKNKPSGHLNANRAPLRAHESILVFGAAEYDPQFTTGHEPMHAATRVSSSALYGKERSATANAGTTQRYATSVLRGDVVNNDADIRIHPTQKPYDLLRWIVRAYSRPGDLVADPTCGSGSFVQAARTEGRRAVGWEADPATASAAQRWLGFQDLALFARAAGDDAA